MTILFFVYLICFLVLAWRRLDYSIILFLAVLPSYLLRFSVFGIPTTLLEGMILIIFVVWLWRFTSLSDYLLGRKKSEDYFCEKRNRLAYPFSFEIAAVLLVSFVAVGIAHFDNSALGIWKAYFFEPVLFFIVLLNMFRLNGHKEKITFDKIILGLSLSVFAVSVLAGYQKITGQLIFNDFWAKEPGRRAVSFYGYPNAISLFVAPLLAILFGWITEKLKIGWQPLLRFEKVYVIFTGASFILGLVSIYAARSEGAMIGLIVAAFITSMMIGTRMRWAGIAVAIVVVGAIFSYQPLKSKVINYATLNNFSGNVRRAQWRETWKMLNDGNLAFGVGLSNYQAAVKPYHVEGMYFNKDNDPDFARKIVIFNSDYKKKYWQPLEIYFYPHNIILNFWVELGLVGMLLFVWIILKYFVLSILNWRADKNNYLNIGLFAAMVVIVVHGIVDVPYFKNDLSVVFWLLLAMVSWQRILDKKL